MYIGYACEAKEISKDDLDSTYKRIEDSLTEILNSFNQKGDILLNESKDNSSYKFVFLVNLDVELDGKKIKKVLANLDTSVYLFFYSLGVDYYLVMDGKILKGLSGMFALAKAQVEEGKINGFKNTQAKIDEILNSYDIA